MPTRKDSRTGHWFFRFKKYGRNCFKGGFLTQERAKQEEAKAYSKIENSTPGSSQDLTVAELCDWWLEGYATTKRSKKNDISRVGLMKEFFGNKIRLRDLQPEKIEEFLARLSELRGEPVGLHTRNHYLAMLKAMINRRKKKRLFTGDNPAEYVDIIKVPTVKVRFLYPAEEKILSPVMAQNPDIYAYYFTALHTGMRISELLKIKVKDIDMTLNHIFIPHPKNNRSRYVPMSDELATFVADRIKGKSPDDRVLPTWGYTYLLVGFKAICLSVGIEDITLHTLRHTFACRLLTKGVPIYLVSKILGHSSSKVTEEHYGHLAVADLANAIDKINGVVSGSCSRIATATNQNLDSLGALVGEYAPI